MVDVKVLDGGCYVLCCALCVCVCTRTRRDAPARSMSLTASLAAERASMRAHSSSWGLNDSNDVTWNNDYHNNNSNDNDNGNNNDDDDDNNNNNNNNNNNRDGNSPFNYQRRCYVAEKCAKKSSRSYQIVQRVEGKMNVDVTKSIFAITHILNIPDFADSI